jgi:sporulation protein YlmC with PRC-barrel domain
MLQNIKELYGHRISAIDGDFGQVKDFYFDDKNWVIRYLVVDTGSWLTGRLVLLTPHAFAKWDRFENTLHVKLTKRQIERSPSIEAHKPVSRQDETEYYRYYGWPVYWNGGAMWGMGGFPVVLPYSRDETQAHLKLHHRDDKHLQSSQAVAGYQIQTTDGTIGQVTGFLVDSRSWVIRELVVETGHWYSGKEILISPAKVERISYEEAKVYLSLSKAEVQHTAENTLATAGAEYHGLANATD